MSAYYVPPTQSQGPPPARQPSYKRGWGIAVITLVVAFILGALIVAAGSGSANKPTTKTVAGATSTVTATITTTAVPEPEISVVTETTTPQSPRSSPRTPGRRRSRTPQRPRRGSTTAST